MKELSNLLRRLFVVSLLSVWAFALNAQGKEKLNLEDMLGTFAAGNGSLLEIFTIKDSLQQTYYRYILNTEERVLEGEVDLSFSEYDSCYYLSLSGIEWEAWLGMLEE